MTEQGQLPSYPSSGQEWTNLQTAGEFASWGRRAGAFLLDSLVVWAIAAVLTGITGHHELWNLHLKTVNGHVQTGPVRHDLLFWTVATPIVTFCYAVAFLASPWQATPCMRLLQTRIRRASDGGRVGIGRSLVRALVVAAFSSVAVVASFIGLLVALVDYLWPLWDARRQTLHDKVAQTVVMHRLPT